MSIIKIISSTLWSPETLAFPSDLQLFHKPKDFVNNFVWTNCLKNLPNKRARKKELESNYKTKIWNCK